jgi:hypothetical protein
MESRWIWAMSGDGIPQNLRMISLAVAENWRRLPRFSET